jgi:hypothetical protein
MDYGPVLKGVGPVPRIGNKGESCTCDSGSNNVVCV